MMNARPDVGSVVHTHAPAALSFAALDQPLLALSHDGGEFAEPQVARFTLTGSLINSAELGRELAKTIGDGAGCLIPRHGLVTVGPDAATAVMRAVLLARACHVQLQAMAAGEIKLWSDSAEIELKKGLVWAESQMNAGYAFLCRQSG
jgi:ribulose-5-phosphate 4-epimerase/fuculose-1-phosphate aldolase